MPVFNPEAIHEVGRRHLGRRPFADLFDAVGTDLAALYPGRVHLDQPLVFRNPTRRQVRYAVILNRDAAR